jgi:hypothetical protein
VQGPKARTSRTITLGPMRKGKITKAYDPKATVTRKTRRSSSTSSSLMNTTNEDTPEQMYRKLTVYNMYDESRLPSNFYNRNRTVKTDLYRTYVLDNLRLFDGDKFLVRAGSLGDESLYDCIRMIMFSEDCKCVPDPPSMPTDRVSIPGYIKEVTDLRRKILNRW